jgi:hypothetical protein
MSQQEDELQRAIENADHSNEAELRAAIGAVCNGTGLSSADVLRAVSEADTARPPHQKRVISEYADLEAKLTKLGEFFETSTFKSLGRVERGRLIKQHAAMGTYADILAERIMAFGTVED